MKPLLLVAAISIAACVPEPEIGALDPNPGGGGAPEKLSTITTNIFVPKCATSGCHAGHPPPSAPGSYEPEFVWGDTVLVPSLQASGMNVVEPFDPENSYLMYKLRGTAGNVGGTATPMPIGYMLLTDSEIAAVEAWILNGAQND